MAPLPKAALRPALGLLGGLPGVDGASEPGHLVSFVVRPKKRNPFH
jgi:hypothetical protein